MNEQTNQTEKQLIGFPNFPNFQIRFYYNRISWRGAKVVSKTRDTLTVKLYNLELYDLDFPRTHADALVVVVSFLENNPLESGWKNFAKTVDWTKDSLIAGRRLIRSVEVSGFENLIANKEIWENTGKHVFDDALSSDVREKLMQATMTIQVNNSELLDTIEVGTECNIPKYEFGPIWYLENKTTDEFYALYQTPGGKWIAHEGQIGTEGARKPTKGISKGYYKLTNERAENEAFKKLDDGFELIYRNFDTKYNLEEELTEAIRANKINETKSDASEEAFSYIENNDVEGLKKLLECGVHPDHMKKSYGTPAIQNVADSFEPNAAIFKLLLEYGADPNQPEGNPLVNQLSYSGKEELLQILLDAGPDVNVFDDEARSKWSTLQSACHGGVFWFVKQLLENGADIHYQTDKGTTALNHAVEAPKNGVEIIDLLLEHGADKNELNQFYYERNVFERAKTPEVLHKLLALGMDINMPGKHEKPAIYHVAEFESVALFTTFLELKAHFGLYQIMYALSVRLHIDKRDYTTRQIDKLKVLHQSGYQIDASSGISVFDDLIGYYKNRKKIAKWEEQALLDLWELGCRPKKTIVFTQYVQKVNSKALLEKLDLLKNP